MSKPRVFIGSSVEGVRIAEAVFACLRHSTVPTLWSHGLFRPGRYPLQELERQLKRHSFAVLVASADDKLFKRGEEGAAMRDNLLVEFGMFTGGIGSRQVFFVCPSEPALVLPSDLAGIIHAKYDAERVQGDASEIAAAVQVPCLQIRDVVEEEWSRIERDRESARTAVLKSKRGKALARLHGAAVQLRDALMAVQRDAFAAFSDEAAFREVKTSAAHRVKEISASFSDDAELIEVQQELDLLTEKTAAALADLPFPRELGLGKDAARAKALDVGAGALSVWLSGGDAVGHVSRAASSEAGGRVESLKQRFTEWWEQHSPPLQAATRELQDALFRSAMSLPSEGVDPLSEVPPTCRMP
ncbi:MAG: TIR domain-containing protein [Acidobacteriota bacterium]